MTMDSLNCSYGSLAVWDNLVNCVVDKEHVTGQILSGVAVPLWSSAHICHYVILRSRVKSASSTRIMTFLFTHWLSECIGVVSAFLAQQWLSQIVFGMCLLLLHTICCIHYMFAPLPTQTNIVAIDKKLTVRSRSRLKNCPHMLSLLFLPAVILTIHGDVLPTSNYMRAVKQPTTAAVTDFHTPHILGFVFVSLACVLFCAIIPHIVGYVFGSLAGVLYCAVGLIDMLDSILIQRSVQKRKGKRRKLSREDTECLLSSESETEFYCDDSDEEVIWMPLKSVQSAIPTHPVCVSRVQIISEADVPPDVTSSQDEEAARPRDDIHEFVENHETETSQGDEQTNDDDIAVNQDNYN